MVYIFVYSQNNESFITFITIFLYNDKNILYYRFTYIGGVCMNKGLYDSSFEHDNCGIGAVVNIKGVKTHMTVSNALKIVEQLEH